MGLITMKNSQQEKPSTTIDHFRLAETTSIGGTIGLGMKK